MTIVACVCNGIPQTVLHASEMSMRMLLSEVFLFVVFGVAVVLLVS